VALIPILPTTLFSEISIFFFWFLWKKMTSTWCLPNERHNKNNNYNSTNGYQCLTYFVTGGFFNFVWGLFQLSGRLWGKCCDKPNNMMNNKQTNIKLKFQDLIVYEQSGFAIICQVFEIQSVTMKLLRLIYNSKAGI
jgi:hypothetical protein